MGITIDECIEKLKHEKQCFIDEHWHNDGVIESYDIAIDTMQKYQEIQSIYNKFANTQCEHIGMQEIGKILSQEDKEQKSH